MELSKVSPELLRTELTSKKAGKLEKLFGPELALLRAHGRGVETQPAVPLFTLTASGKSGMVDSLNRMIQPINQTLKGVVLGSWTQHAEWYMTRNTRLKRQDNTLYGKVSPNVRTAFSLLTLGLTHLLPEKTGPISYSLGKSQFRAYRDTLTFRLITTKGSEVDAKVHTNKPI